MTTTPTITPTQADRVAMAAYYLHPLIANPSLAEGVLADDWEKGCSDCERAFLETLAAHRINTLAIRTIPSPTADRLALVESLREAIVELWHESTSDTALHVHLGMTEEEYGAWANPSALTTEKAPL